MSQNQKKLIASFPLLLHSKESKIKIGKINETINTDKSLLTKDPSSKQYRLIEKKNNNEETRYSGNLMTDQISKYLIFNFNQDTGKIEAIPAGDWYFYKKEPNFQPLSIEEAEEKMKNKSSLLDYVRNKNILTKSKKDKKPGKKEDSSFPSRSNIGRNITSDDDEIDEARQNMFDKIEEQSEEERPEDIDLELKEADSDIEEAFIKGKSTKDTEVKVQNNEEDSFTSDDELFGDEDEDVSNNEGSEIDEDADFSEIDKEDEFESKKTKTENNDLLGVKRKADESILTHSKVDIKKKTTNYLEQVLDSLFAKNKSMTYERISKEISKMNFSKTEIEHNLPTLLSRICDKYPQGGEFYYFKKSEK